MNDWGHLPQEWEWQLSQEYIDSILEDLEFMSSDYGIQSFWDIPCPLDSYISNLTKVSTSSIERLIEILPFVEFRYEQN